MKLGQIGYSGYTIYFAKIIFSTNSEIRASIIIDAIRKQTQASQNRKRSYRGSEKKIRLFFATVSHQLVQDNWSADALEP